MKHWIRDLDISSELYDWSEGMPCASFVVYHFLKNAGWTWLWECDGELDNPNHCPDGNMEDSSVTDWTLSGAGTRSKSTSQIQNGKQSLSWVSAASETLTSASFTNLTDAQTYEQVIWVYNNSGNAFTFDVFDGNAFGSSTNLTSTGGWASYRITFTKNVAGSAYFRCSAPVGAGTIYIDSCMTFESFFEYNTSGLIADYTDGEIKAANVFASASHTFVAGDVGRVVIAWDGTNEGNSGAYAVTSVSAGEATLEIRVGGSETLTITTGLTWRLIDLSAAPRTELTSAREAGCGWGLESPYSSANWRLFYRHNYDSGSTNNKYIQVWASPTDCDFNTDDGSFYLTDVSTQMVDPTYSFNLGSGAGHILFGPGYNDSMTEARLYLMIDDDSTFVTWTLRPNVSYNAYSFMGFTGSDSYHTLQESWCLSTRYNDTSRNLNEIYLSNAYTSWGYSGLQPSPAGTMERCLIGVYGYATSSVPYLTSNRKVNPFNSSEWLHKPFLVRDPFGTGRYPAQKSFGDQGIFISRQQTDWTTFDSDEYLHLSYGVCWEWPNVSVVT
ncbi:hypothetical protein DRO54_04840 [Candidatus Bathyarchaeota archaeon]|nr:MAG: hypothetical protein DRO54_04840 [Candidatus Bathyarchaeota archaeon]